MSASARPTPERGGARYDLNVSKKLFAFGFTDIEADEFQKLDLRVAPGGGFGFHAYKKEKNFLDFFGRRLVQP